MAVGNENVSKAPHDDVVRMVGISTGTLTLQVAENYNSSDSSDEEYRHRKVRYPNRVRTRPPGMGTSSNRHGDKVLAECNQRDRHTSSGSTKNREHSGRHDSGHRSSSHHKHRSHAPVGAENSLPPPLNSSKSPQLTGPLSVEHRGVSTVASVQATPIMNYPVARHSHIKKVSQSAQPVRHQPAGSHDRPNRPMNTSLTASSISAILKTSVNNTTNSTANNAFISVDDDEEDVDEESLLEGNFQDTKVVVGYIGSIEIPSDANKPHIKIQSIRNAVRRLRVEQKIHTLVLMDVSEEGVKLTNIMGTTVAHYPVDRISFSGISPDDKRFFGIVTLHNFGSDEASSDNGSQDEAPTSSGSCHVFMVDPELRAHNIHEQKAKAFKINCSQHADRPGCAEFPKSATSIILSITNLYKDRPNIDGDNDVALSLAFADPSQAVQRSTSNSSNSDSGLGFGREEVAVNERVVVVDMPPPLSRAPRHHAPDGGASRQVGGAEGGRFPHHHGLPDNPTIPTPLRSSQRNIHSDTNHRLDTSNTSNGDDSVFVRSTGYNKYNIRAMPVPGHNVNDPSNDLDPEVSANTLRASMHKYLLNRQGPEYSTSSDQESARSGPTKGPDIFRSSSQPDLNRPLTPPMPSHHNFYQDDDFCKVVDMDDDRLSPRAMLPPPFHQLRSPSAPPVLENSFEMEEDMETTANTSVMGRLIDRMEHDDALRISSPADTSLGMRRFSESETIGKKVRLLFVNSVLKTTTNLKSIFHAAESTSMV